VSKWSDKKVKKKKENSNKTAIKMAKRSVLKHTNNDNNTDNTEVSFHLCLQVRSTEAEEFIELCWDPSRLDAKKIDIDFSPLFHFKLSMQ
jgi:hypothetical protein